VSHQNSDNEKRQKLEEFYVTHPDLRY